MESFFISRFKSVVISAVTVYPMILNTLFTDVEAHAEKWPFLDRVAAAAHVHRRPQALSRATSLQLLLLGLPEPRYVMLESSDWIRTVRITLIEGALQKCD